MNVMLFLRDLDVMGQGTRVITYLFIKKKFELQTIQYTCIRKTQQKQVSIYNTKKLIGFTQVVCKTSCLIVGIDWVFVGSVLGTHHVSSTKLTASLLAVCKGGVFYMESG